MRGLINRARSNPKRVVFPEGDEPKIIRAARICVEEGICMPMLLGDRDVIEAKAREMNISLEDIVIEDPINVAASATSTRSTCGRTGNAKA